jgi:hypothetical protein
MFHREYFTEAIYTLYPNQAGSFITRELGEITSKKSII